MKPLLAIVLALCLGACTRSELPPPAQVSPTQPPPAQAAAPTNKDPRAARELIASGAIVIDVRTPDEYASRHLSRAINIPVQELPRRIAEIEVLVAGDRTRPIVVYCAAGARAAEAKAQLDAAGFSSVVNGVGLDDLRAEDRP
ncbi:MAG TPA: rhodanese-like domain-containing protein [Kofleriaceae bacterium]|nr:rhodanese-like domain-containing protein [Kofleriaceae bacterium]